jgi:hypothetical protein
VNVTVGPVSVSVFTNPQTGGIIGGTVGLGPGPIPIGGSGSYDVTCVASAAGVVTCGHK